MLICVGVYIAPEMYRNEAFDRSVDTFAFGLILYEVCNLSHFLIWKRQWIHTNSVLQLSPVRSSNEHIFLANHRTRTLSYIYCSDDWRISCISPKASRGSGQDDLFRGFETIIQE